MSVYIGGLGRLVELPYVTSASVTPADRYTFEETLEGRVKSQARTAIRRTWALSASRYLAQAQGTLMSFINGEWGYGPFVWVSSDAPVTNLLTPEVSSCGPAAAYTASAQVGGPMPLGDGRVAGRSVMNSDLLNNSFLGGVQVPVLPGRPVTASAWVLGEGAQVFLHWRDAAGGVTGATIASTITGRAGQPARIHLTGTPPASAASCLMSTRGAMQATRPAITWTDQLFDWADGQGCPSAVVHGVAKDIQSAHRDPNGFRAADMSFTITEVG